MVPDDVAGVSSAPCRAASGARRGWWTRRYDLGAVRIPVPGPRVEIGPGTAIPPRRTFAPVVCADWRRASIGRCGWIEEIARPFGA